MPTNHSPGEAGLTLLELLIVVAIVGTLAALSMLVLPSVITVAKADSGSSQALAVLRTCRERAITERRSVEVAFEGTERIACRRREVDATGRSTGVLTLVQELALGERMEFLRFPD